MKGQKSAKDILLKWYDFRIKVIAEGAVVGVIAGILAIAYRIVLEKTFSLSRYIYGHYLNHIGAILGWFVILILCGYIVGKIIKKEPMSSGSGIPQVEGTLLRKFDMNWWRVLLAKFLGGTICIFGGLSVGREGPSIQMGAVGGMGLGKILKRVNLEEKFLITSGASAGLAAAFNAPLSGVMFALEELHKNFSPIVMASALAASIAADFASKNVFGIKPMLSFQHVQAMPLYYYFYIIILGAIVGVMGHVFNRSLIGAQRLYAKPKWLKKEHRPMIAFVIAGFVGLFLPLALGGGHDLIMDLTSIHFTVLMLLILFLVKFVFTMISYGSSVPGGIFLPLLALGALIGCIYGNLLETYFGLEHIYIQNLIILGMAGYFTAIVKAPITGCVLITEMTGSFVHLLPVGLVCLSAYIVSDLLKSKPIYEELLENMLSETEIRKYKENNKVIIELAVCAGALIEDKSVKDINWPEGCLVVGIMRGKKEIIPRGETKIYVGDYLIVLADEPVASQVRDDLSRISEVCN